MRLGTPLGEQNKKEYCAWTGFQVDFYRDERTGGKARKQNGCGNVLTYIYLTKAEFRQ